MQHRYKCLYCILRFNCAPCSGVCILLDILQFLSMPPYKDGYRDGNKIVGAGGTFNWKLHESLIDVQEIVVAIEEGTIEGDFKIINPKSLDHVTWVKGEITRFYPVSAHANEAIKLTDEPGKTIWSG